MNRTKELKRMNRQELLELLLEATEENESLKKKIQSLEEQLASKEIAVKEAGSIAEAALTLNGVFDAAQAAAAQYLDNIKQLSGNQEMLCRQMEASAREKAQEICDKADAYSQKIRTEADEYSRMKRNEADSGKKQAEEKVTAHFQERGNSERPASAQ